VLADNGIEGRDVPDSQFLPEDDWLDSSKVDDALSGVSGGGAAASTCPCGTGLIAATLGGTALQEGVPVTVSTDGAPELDVQVQNQGASDLSGVTVSVSVNGGSAKDRDISSIAPGETQTVTIPITPVPSGQTTLDVEVKPVPGEEVTDNNSASYTVTFQ
jgi:CARDB protein